MEPTPLRHHTPAITISSFCSVDGCVGVRLGGTDVGVTDTKATSGGEELRFTREEWAAFVAGVKNGEFDL